MSKPPLNEFLGSDFHYVGLGPLKTPKISYQKKLLCQNYQKYTEFCLIFAVFRKTLLLVKLEICSYESSNALPLVWWSFWMVLDPSKPQNKLSGVIFEPKMPKIHGNVTLRNCPQKNGHNSLIFGSYEVRHPSMRSWDQDASNEMLPSQIWERCQLTDFSKTKTEPEILKKISEK